MRSHEKHGCSGATSRRCRPPIVLVLLLAVGAAVAWFVRRRHVAGMAEADAWRQDLPEWAGPSGTGAATAARQSDVGASAALVEKPAPVPAPSPKPAPVPSPAPAPAATPAPAPVTDDLRRIEGVGPKIATALVAADLGTYAAVADASEGDLRAALKDAGLRFAPSLSTWARQARLLADGDEAGFLALTERLVAGREEG